MQTSTILMANLDLEIFFSEWWCQSLCSCLGAGPGGGGRVGQGVVGLRVRGLGVAGLVGLVEVLAPSWRSWHLAWRRCGHWSWTDSIRGLVGDNVDPHPHVRQTLRKLLIWSDVFIAPRMYLCTPHIFCSKELFRQESKVFFQRHCCNSLIREVYR